MNTTTLPLATLTTALTTTLLLTTALSSTACQPKPTPPETTTPSTPNSEKAITPEPLLLEGPIDHPLGLTREPIITQHQNGTLFVSGYGTQSAAESHPNQAPLLFKSTDNGTTFTKVDVGTPEDGAKGNSDVDLAIGPDGTLYFASMGFDRTTFRGTHIAIGVSQDVGENWTWTMLSDTEYDDRPWVVVTPDAVAHVVWNDGSGVSYARGTDRGTTWVEQPKIRPAGGSSHLAAGSSGQLAVRISPMSASANKYHEGVDLIAVSLDGGDTWEEKPLPGSPKWPVQPADFAVEQRWVEPLAWDDNGHLFHLWAEGPKLFFARSTDNGSTWQSWEIANHPDRFFYPFLTAKHGSIGEFAATWYAGSGDTLTATIAKIVLRGDGPPKVSQSAPLVLDILDVARDGKATRGTGGEYFPALFLNDGSLAAATTLAPANGEAGFSWWKAES